MLELVAASLEDGWAFVKKAGRLLLLKPPYRQVNVIPVSEDILEKALHAYGFASIHVPYDTWNQLIAFLRAELSKVHESKLNVLPGVEMMYELLFDAPRDILVDYLNRTESELIPNREWPAALDLLTVLMRVDSVRGEPDLYARAINLLRRCSKGLADAKVGREELTADTVAWRFPGVAKHYPVQSVMDYMRNVADRHPVLPMGAA